jgi:hypothetical protein
VVALQLIHLPVTLVVAPVLALQLKTPVLAVRLAGPLLLAALVETVVTPFTAALVVVEAVL